MRLSAVALAICAAVKPAYWESTGAEAGASQAVCCAALKLVGRNGTLAPARKVKMLRESDDAVTRASSRGCAEQTGVFEIAPDTRSMVRASRSPSHFCVR